MQQDPNTKYPPSTAKIPVSQLPTASAAPTVNPNLSASAAQARTQPPTASNANTGAGQAPVPGRAGAHPRVNHVPYSQVPLPGQYGGAQGRRPVPQQSTGPGPQAYYQGYASNMNPAALSYANNYMATPTSNYMAAPYAAAGNYYRAPTAPVAQGTIGTAPQMPTRDFQAQAVGTQPRVTVPPKKSKAIPIVNPDTKEEVKISKAAQPKPVPTPQVSPPIRKPLEVVAPTAASDSSQLAGDTQTTSNKSKNEMKTVPAKEAIQVAVKAVAGAEQSTNPSAPPAKEKLSSVAAVVDQKSVVVPAVSEKESVCSDLSENKVEMTETEKSSEPAKLNLQADGNKCETNASDVSASAESGPDSVSANRDDGKIASEKPAEAAKESAPKTDANLGSSSSAATSASPPEQQYSSPPRRSRPTSPEWVEGMRRVYSIPFLRSMKEFANLSAVDGYNDALKKNNVSNSQRGPRDHGGRRGGRGLASDPRGRGVLEPGGGYNSSRGGGGVLGGGGAYMDSFDLSGARNRAPPPQGSNRSNYDSRGSRDGGRGSRSHGPMRGGVGPLDPYEHLPPVEKLAKSENHWARKKENDTVLQAKTKLMKSLLNKLTHEKYGKIKDKILEIELTSPGECEAIVKEVFEKTLFEPKFADLYAKLCYDLGVSTMAMFSKFSTPEKEYTFRKVLLKMCQVEFQRPQQEAAAASAQSEDAANPSSSQEESAKTTEDSRAEEEMRKTKVKRRMLANIRFIGELYLVKLIGEPVIHQQCVQYLLTRAIKQKEEDILEGFCKLMSGVGKELENGRTPLKQHMSKYFEKIEELSRDSSLPKRSRYMLMDLLDLRRNGWVPRREEQKAKKISEVHADIANEDKKKAQMQANMKNYGGNRGPRDRAGRDSQRGGRFGSNQQPSMNMTMATQRTSSQTKRADATLERYVGRTRPPGNLSNMRLGPGSGSSRPSANGGWSSVTSRTRGSGNSASSGVAQLRPQRSSSSGSQSATVTRANKFVSLSVQSKPAPTTDATSKGPELMTEETCKKKAKSALTEYWETKLEDEVVAIFESEVGPLNAAKFVEYSLRSALDGKISKRPEGVPYFKCLADKTTISADAIVTGFTSVLEELDMIVVDDPRSPEFMAMYLAAIYSTKKMSEAGLGFVKPAFRNSFGKSPVKVVGYLLNEIKKASTKETEEGKNLELRTVYDTLGINVAVAASTLFPAASRGLDFLVDFLKEIGLSYLFPHLHVDKFVIEKINQDVPGEQVFEELKNLEGVDDVLLKSANFARTVVIASLTFSFDQFVGAKDIAKKIPAGPGKLLKLCNNGKSPSAEVQYDVLLAVQDFLHQYVSKDNAGPLDDEHKGKKPGYVAFDALYDADIVEEETFMKWKSDESDRVMNVGGKDKVLLQTASWFSWLANAEVEATE